MQWSTPGWQTLLLESVTPWSRTPGGKVFHSSGVRTLKIKTLLCLIETVLLEITCWLLSPANKVKGLQHMALLPIHTPFEDQDTLHIGTKYQAPYNPNPCYTNPWAPSRQYMTGTTTRTETERLDVGNAKREFYGPERWPDSAFFLVKK